MLRLPDLRKYRLFPFVLLVMTGFALGNPLLSALGFENEAGMFLFWLGLFSASGSGFSLLKPRIRPFALIALSALFGFLLLRPDSLPARAFHGIKALMSGAPLQESLTLYLDAFLPLIALFIALYSKLLMEGDPVYAAPLLISPLVMLWFLGSKQDIKVYVPAMAALPLLYAYSKPEESFISVPERRGSGQPLFRLLALTLALALLGLSLSPAQPVTNQAFKEKADALRQMIDDYFFFTDSREMFSLRQMGYQPMGEKGLGGKPRLSAEPLLLVQTDEKVYLRGTAMNLYTGRSWEDSLSNERFGYTSFRFGALRDRLFDAALPSLKDRAPQREIKVETLRAMTSTIFVPQRLRKLDSGEGMVPYFNASSEMFITRNLKPGDQYSLSYEAYTAGEAETDRLAKALRGIQDPEYAHVVAEYTQLPKHLTPDGVLAKLAKEVTQGIISPYEQALAIQNYLKSHYSYKLDVPNAPKDRDFVAYFLFEEKAGYCTYFASAMTVLCRQLSLPARYVEGFVAKPQADGKPTSLSSKDAHAWTEVYIAGLGWVTFDAGAGNMPNENQNKPQNKPEPSPSPDPSPSPSPTPPDGEQQPTSPSPSPEAMTPSPRPSETPPEDQPDNNTQNPPEQSFWPWLLLLLASIALILRVLATEPSRAQRKCGDEEQLFKLYWRENLRIMRLKGLKKMETETLLEYALRSAPEDAGFYTLALAQSAQRYGSHKPSAAEAALAQARYAKLWQGLRPLQRAILALNRALTPSEPFKAGLRAFWQSSNELFKRKVRSGKSPEKAAKRKDRRKKTQKRR